MRIGKTAYNTLQFSWGILQNIVGAAVFLILIKREHFKYKNCTATIWKNNSSASIGRFIFISDKIEGDFRDKTIAHEYGHTIQSIILGPLYLPVISLPSMLWCMLPFFQKLRDRKNISYYSFYPERWADKLGGVNKR